MVAHTPSSSVSWPAYIFSLCVMGLGAILAACSVELFLIPNRIIDGGIVGVSMIFSQIFGGYLLPYFLILFNIPFLFLAYRNIGRTFVIQMFISVLMFAGFISYFHSWPVPELETLEVVVVGGMILGIGIGLIIRMGACLDGTEILGILINRRYGFSVGQVVLSCNFFIFGIAGFVYGDWHTSLLSFITFIVVIKMMDLVIVGLDETKSVMIFSNRSREISKAIMHELGLGLTVLHGKGGFSGEETEILYVITERLQLAEVKEIIYREDPAAFVAIENLHEAVNGRLRAPERRRGILPFG